MASLKEQVHNLKRDANIDEIEISEEELNEFIRRSEEYERKFGHLDRSEPKVDPPKEVEKIEPVVEEYEREVERVDTPVEEAKNSVAYNANPRLFESIRTKDF